MNQLHFLSVRSARGTRGRLPRPASAQGVRNDIPNFYLSINPSFNVNNVNVIWRAVAERIVSPLTAVFVNAGLRMKRSA